MKIELSFTEIQRAIADFEQQVGGQCQLEPSETLFRFPASLGQGYLRGIQLRDGLDLFIQEHILTENLLLDFQPLFLQNSFADLSFCLSGQCSGIVPGLSSHYTMRAREMSFSTVPNAAGSVEFSAGEQFNLVDIILSPTLILNLIGEDLAKLPPSWQSNLQQGASSPLLHFSQIPAEIAQILTKVIHCPYQGVIRSLYLEGKALELIALYFSQFYDSQNQPQSAPLSRRETDRLRESRALLKQNLMSPPSLAELSRQVGLSERKLQQGFRELFGTTVFGVLHNDRMEYARQLLEMQQMSIGAIADAVGISHRGYFSKAFKRRFGSTPREYARRFSSV